VLSKREDATSHSDVNEAPLWNENVMAQLGGQMKIFKERGRIHTLGASYEVKQGRDPQN